MTLKEFTYFEVTYERILNDLDFAAEIRNELRNMDYYGNA